MAEKEERILHIVQKLDGRFVGQSRISRQEAINRMAKALCADDVMREGYYQMAEAALNALLGVEK